ncbi:scavenger receptor class B member 1-like isoform X2 [Amphiura filiformis]|uniref:scavenger receptor class B member 1-like isoform X2 n=1 Tax=Amphiura filiformis TaxID=82378 RepID=UPI003B20CE2B
MASYHDQDVALVPGTTAYDGFEEMAVPMRMQYWVWDILNPDDFLMGDKPIMEQKGPYTYLEYRNKLNITHDHDEGTVSFRGRTNYQFVPEESVGLESDTFWTVNVPVFTVANLLKDQPGPIKNIQRLIHELSNATSVLELSVYDVIWGYEDAYLLLFDELFPGQIPTTIFGLFAGTNYTAGKPWVLKTGEKDIKDVGQVVSWNGLTELDFWGTEWANMINGTDASTTAPFKKSSEDVYVFVGTICRSGYLTYQRENELEGLKTGRYQVPFELFANATINPDNIGFCYPDENNCHPTGMINAEPCQSGAPVFFSLPHFLYGDPLLLEGVIGMEPNEEEHILSFDVEMLTGIVFAVSNRIQVNLKVQSYNTVPDTRFLRTTYVPMVWLNESSIIDAESAEFFKSSIILPLLIARIAVGLLIGIGGVMIIAGIIGYCCLCKDEKKVEKKPIEMQGSYNKGETNHVYEKE